MPEEICGIYAITNTITGDSYIGSSRQIHNRWNAHRNALNKGKHARKSFNEAWAKYGADVFTFTVLEIVEDKRQSLLDREQFYINQRHAQRDDHGYNEGRGSSMRLANEYQRKVALKQYWEIYADQVAIDVAALMEHEDKWRHVVLSSQKSFDVFRERVKEADTGRIAHITEYAINFAVECVRQFGFPPEDD